MNKIKQTFPDKINGKLVKYKQGDCLSIHSKDGKYLAAFTSDKFNNFYDLTCIEFYEVDKPQMNNFINGKFFGTRFGSWEDLSYAVDKQMIKCKYIDNSSDIEKIGTVKFNAALVKAGYAYLETIQELYDYYLEELPIRIEKSSNAERFPDLAFASKHLVDMKDIIE